MLTLDSGISITLSAKIIKSIISFLLLLPFFLRFSVKIYFSKAMYRFSFFFNKMYKYINLIAISQSGLKLCPPIVLQNWNIVANYCFFLFCIVSQ